MKYLGATLLVSLTTGYLLISAVHAEDINSLVFDYHFESGGNNYELQVSPNGTNLGFRQFNDEGELIVVQNPQSERLFTSNDFGETWDEHLIPPHPEGPKEIHRGFFTTSQGSWLVWQPYKDGFQTGIWRFSPDTNEWNLSIGGGHRYSWLGTISIAESNGAIMYAEYEAQGNATEMRVFRSWDDGVTWEIVFTVATPKGDGTPKINHFHTLQVDPYTGHWWLSSGDFEGFCYIWRSTNDGDTWVDISDLTPPHPKAQRLTGFIFYPDHVVWATDDTLRVDGVATGAALMSSPKTSPLQITDHGYMSEGVIRFAINFGEEIGHLFIAENVPGTTPTNPPDEIGIELVFVTPELEIIQIGSLPFLGYFTSSRGGFDAVGNIFLGRHGYTNGQILENPDLKFQQNWEYVLTQVPSIDITTQGKGAANVTEEAVTSDGVVCFISAVPETGSRFLGLYDIETGEEVWAPSFPTAGTANFSVLFDRNMTLVAKFEISENVPGLPTNSFWGLVIAMFLFSLLGVRDTRFKPQ